MDGARPNVGAAVSRFLNRAWLFARIVGREWEGGRLTPADAWYIARVVWP